MSESTIAPATGSLAFAPSPAVFERALGLVASTDSGNGSAVPEAGRRAAFERYESLPVPGTRPARGWRHDYGKLSYAGLQWEAEPSVLRLSKPDGAPSSVELLPLERARGTVALSPARFEPFANDKFAQLAIAFQNCGAFVHVPDGVVVETPIQLVFSYAGVDPDAQAVFPHVVVVLGKGARAAVYERHIGTGAPYVCGLAALQLGEGASLDYAVIQDASEEARIFMHRTARCERDAALRWHDAELGATLTRSTLHTTLAAAGASAHTAALFFNTGFEHADLTTTTEHAAGATTSHTVVRTAASDLGQGRFFGNIVITPHAHAADATLRDDALLLSKRAQIESVPALEIAANDVKAFHGATVGSLDRETLFYAQSRGIAKSDAVRMVALAFFEPAISLFPTEALRDEVRSTLDHKIDAATDIDA